MNGVWFDLEVLVQLHQNILWVNTIRQDIICIYKQVFIIFLTIAFLCWSELDVWIAPG
jgi:hypothetical protein